MSPAAKRPFCTIKPASGQTPSKIRLRHAEATEVNPISGDGVARHPFFLSRKEGEARAAWLHLPQGAQPRVAGVVLCPPLGFEAVHSHRTFRRLADELARAGFVCLRFDYRGTGNSPGDAFSPDLVQSWLDDIAAAAAFTAEVAGCERVSLIGLRMGALLAAEATRTKIAAEHLILWAPVRRGKRYLREQRAVAATSAAQSPLQGGMEAAGFVLSDDTMAALEPLSLSAGGYSLNGDALVLERDDLPAPKSLAPHFDEHDVQATVLRPPGYAGMMANPHFTEIPAAALEQIVQWLTQRAPAQKESPQKDLAQGDSRQENAPWEGEPQVDSPPVESALRVRSTISRLLRNGGAVRQHLFMHAGVPLHEELCCLPQPRLFGVLTEPCRPSDPDQPLVLLSNGGAVHTVGPNRVYVELARALAAAGYRVFRLDLRNLGDSLTGAPDDENHPYPPTAMDDLRAAMRWLRQQHEARRFVITGLCSGAYTAFHAGLAEDMPGLLGVLPINPLTFYWTPGMSLAVRPRTKMVRESKRYQRVMRDPARWARLLRGEADLRNAVRFAGKWTRKRLSDWLDEPLQAIHMRAASPLSQDLKRVLARGRKLGFILSEDDAGHDLLMSSAGRTVAKLQRSGAITLTIIEDADHTFTQHAWRQTLVEAMLATLARWR